MYKNILIGQPNDELTSLGISDIEDDLVSNTSNNSEIILKEEISYQYPDDIESPTASKTQTERNLEENIAPVPMHNTGFLYFSIIF